MNCGEKSGDDSGLCEESNHSDFGGREGFGSNHNKLSDFRERMECPRGQLELIWRGYDQVVLAFRRANLRDCSR
jgi:hypothetical protein